MITDLNGDADTHIAALCGQCYHCGLDIPEDVRITSQIEKQSRAFCCHACKAVFELISAGGLENYYQYRSQFADKPDANAINFSEFDNPGFQQSFCQTNANGTIEAQLYVEGLRCAACVWLLEKSLGALAGVRSVNVSLVDNAVQITWIAHQTPLSKIVEYAYHLGYKSSPWSPDNNARLQNEAERNLLRRTGLAGIVMMQVGMFSIALYAGGDQGMTQEYKNLLHWFAALLTTPVLLYSAQGFFIGAWRSLKQFRMSMDVPIALALSIAWLASLINTIRSTGDVYFDSVCMFVFLLSGVRFLELRARNKYTSIANQGALPATCKCLSAADALEYEHRSVHDLQPRQLVYLLQGETVPVDCTLIDASAMFNEASISGEFLPVEKQFGEQILSGAVVQSSSVKLQVQKTANESCLQNLQRLALRARQGQPVFLQISDRVARFFSLGVLIVTAIAASIWYVVDATRTVEIAIAMLVISCPCALSLAAPTAFAVAINYLRRQGVLVCDSLVMEKLNKIDVVAFDKTGTLTKGKFAIHNKHYFTDEAEYCDALARSLEAHSAHPIARAFDELSAKKYSITLQDVTLANSQGVSANESAYENSNAVRIGSEAFCAELTGYPAPTIVLEGNSTCVWLASANQWLACYELRDAIRADARNAIAELQHTTLILSGDNHEVVRSVADMLQVEHWHAACKPQTKLDLIRDLQTRQHKTVMMVGDGVNDLPVLAQADVSIAMNSANHLAQVQADCVLLNNQLTSLSVLFQKARATWRLVKQNIAWALVYNFSALPLAALGFIPPWLAALGMSGSSLLVILNAARLSRAQT